MIDIIGAVLSAISVYQGWATTPTDTKKKTEDFVILLDQLKVLDNVFFGSKKIHDCVEVFFKTTDKSLLILEEAAKGKTSPNELQEKYEDVMFHFERYSNNLPVKLQKVDANFSKLHAHPTLTPDIKNDVEWMVTFYNKMVDKNSNLNTIINHLKSEPPHTNTANSKETISSLNNSMQYLLMSADKVIYHGASVVAHLHTEMRNSI